MRIFLAWITLISFTLASIPLVELKGTELVIFILFGFFSSALTTKSFFNDLKGISLSSWKVTTNGRKWLVSIVGILCGVCNYFSLALVVKHLDHLQGFWLVIIYGLLVILPSSLCGYFFERVFIWGKYSLQK